MAQSSSVTPKWTCLTSQNKALLYLQVLLGKHSGQLINTSLVARSTENILCRATISDFQTCISDFYNWSGKLWVQGRSEREEREDIHGESSICARGEVSLLTPVWNRLPVAPVTQTCSVTPELDQELSTNPELCRVSDYSCTTGSPGLWQGSSWEVQPAFPSARSSALLARQKTPFFQSSRSRESRIQLGSIHNIFELSTNYQLTSTKIWRASAKFDWSQGQSCFIFWMDCSHQSSPGWIASSQAVLSPLELGKHLYFCINNNKGQNW